MQVDSPGAASSRPAGVHQSPRTSDLQHIPVVSIEELPARFADEDLPREFKLKLDSGLETRIIMRGDKLKVMQKIADRWAQAHKYCFAHGSTEEEFRAWTFFRRGASLFE